MKIGKYEFIFLQTIRPTTDDEGKILRYKPQSRYNNKKGLKLNEFGDGEFCRFELDKAESAKGVYAWVVHEDNEPIYIGETDNLKKRFKTGYGIISPRNCYAGGQLTNCKMNKVVLDYYTAGKSIDIYFLKTDDYKKVELELLNSINTRYNKKNN